jgi:hypothetical protein
VLGSHGLSAAEDPVGSVADTCLRHGRCPVVVVPTAASDTAGTGATALPRGPAALAGTASVVVGALGLP